MKILIIRFSALGDLVTLEPSFRAFRYFFKDAEISLLTTSIGKALYEDSSYFDKYIIHKNFFKTINQVPAYDLIINMQCNKPSHLLSFFIKKNHLINRSFSFLEKLLHLPSYTKETREILSLAGIPESLIDQYLSKNEHIILPSLSNCKYSQTIVKLAQGKKTVAISIGSSERWKSKRWGSKKFLELIQKLQNNYFIILIGTSLEKDESDNIDFLCDGKILNLVAQTTISELKSILKDVSLYIGNDSGPSHIAAGVGTNTLTIFGSTDIRHCVKFFKYKGNHHYIKPKENILCHPCYKSICPKNMECMASINVDYVFKTATSILENKE